MEYLHLQAAALKLQKHQCFIWKTSAGETTMFTEIFILAKAKFAEVFHMKHQSFSSSFRAALNIHVSYEKAQ